MAPGFAQLQELVFCFFAGGSLIDFLEVLDEGFLVFGDHIAQAGADLVDDAALHLRECKILGVNEKLQVKWDS